MKSDEVTVRKAENGYVVRASKIKESKANVDAMIKIMRTMGMYESWQEHKEEDIRRALQNMHGFSMPQTEEKEVICGSLHEVSEFLKKFFETDSAPSDQINL
jgi:folylpolyglutamate synthase/dihydropteroate synthase